MLLIGFSGALKALELENQVLKLRNAQLELAGNTETLKGWFDGFVTKFLFESVTVNFHMINLLTDQLTTLVIDPKTSTLLIPKSLLDDLDPYRIFGMKTSWTIWTMAIWLS
jgi:hypothetical protein